jgi:AcrR family transcriptional regulator
MSSPGLRERKKQKTRWAIQEQALRLFAEQGYDATTVEQIAAAAEISPSTFFRYFPTKEDVVVEDEYDAILLVGLDNAPAELSPLGAVRYAVRAAFAGLDAAAQHKIRERTKLVMSVPALRARTLENVTAGVDLIAESLARRMGGNAGDYRVRCWAGACVGVALVAAAEWISNDGESDYAELMDEALAHLESGFASGGGG